MRSPYPSCRRGCDALSPQSPSLDSSCGVGSSPLYFTRVYFHWGYSYYTMKLKSELRYYAPAIALDSIISRRGRKSIQKFLAGALVILGGTLIGLVSYTSVIHGALDTDVLVQEAHILAGIFFMLVGCALPLFSITAFYRTRYFRGTLMTAKED